MNIVGVSAFYHDSAACLVSDNEILAAAQEERFTRIKHDSNFPVNAIQYCLAEACIKAEDIDYVVFYEKPFLKFERLLETYLEFAPKGFKTFSKSIPLWAKEKIFQKNNMVKALKDTFGGGHNWREKILFSDHHLSHAASAFFPSPFERAAVVTLDGVGEWTTTSIGVGNHNELSITSEIRFPHSLGLLYSAFTYYTGFRVNSGEYKVMGLAPYGEPRYANLIRENLVDLKPDGSFKLDMAYFDFCTGQTMTSNLFHELFEGEPRKPETEITQRDMDLAASVQVVTEEMVLGICRETRNRTEEKNICLAGGVALNCVANGNLLRSGIFDNVWIQPAAGDAGGALGAALAVNYIKEKAPRAATRSRDKMSGSYLGPSFSEQQIVSSLKNAGAVFTKLTTQKMLRKTAEAIASEKAIGWFQHRMEFGPRSLGARSILGDARSTKMQKQLNLKVKYRESFRPFAPSILSEHLSDWFNLEVDSPYMLMVANVLKDKQIKLSENDKKLFGIERLNIPKSSIPAVTHVDYSARIQTVHKDTNSLYHALLERFFEITGCPVLVNTSFNVRGEPIVCSPTDAFQCFMGTELDILVVGNLFLEKGKQNSSLLLDYKNKYQLD